MPLFDKSHIDHANHLCSIIDKGTTVKEYSDLVKNGKFVCRQCGRVAINPQNLCDPAEL
jgi:hypothetical protein